MGNTYGVNTYIWAGVCKAIIIVPVVTPELYRGGP